MDTEQPISTNARASSALGSNRDSQNVSSHVSQATSKLSEAAQQAEDGGGVGLFTFGGDLGQDFLNGAQLLGLVIDDEVALVAELLDAPAQDSDAE